MTIFAVTFPFFGVGPVRLPGRPPRHPAASRDPWLAQRQNVTLLTERVGASTGRIERIILVSSWWRS